MPSVSKRELLSLQQLWFSSSSSRLSPGNLGSIFIEVSVNRWWHLAKNSFIDREKSHIISVYIVAFECGKAEAYSELL